MSQPNADPRMPSASAKADLVERARAGDHTAFAILARSAFGRMYGAAKLVLRDQYGAEDAVQEALLLAWRHVATIRDPDAWDVWMYRLTVRVCYRIARARGAREVRELHVRLDRPAPATDFTGAVAERDRIMAALTDLPLEQRAVIVLHFYLDLSMVQAAAVLGVPVGTAKSRLHRGLEALRTSLGEEPELFGTAIRERPT
jgi:RNA polymerase sigma-70 factor (ECF subfamily)